MIFSSILSIESHDGQILAKRGTVLGSLPDILRALSDCAYHHRRVRGF